MIFRCAGSSVPAFLAARSMSPVEICGIPKRSQSTLAWVPFPEPGGPTNTTIIANLPL